MKAIVLAAGRGKRFGSKTKTLPKCLIPLGNTNLLSRYLDTFRALKIKEVVLVVGHLKEKIKKECSGKRAGLKIRFVENKDFEKGSVVSLHTAGRQLNTDVLIMDADVYFPTEALRKLVTSRKKNAFLIDPRSKSSGEEMMLMAKNGRPVWISKKIDRRFKILGEATGILKLSKTSAGVLRKILEDFIEEEIVDVEYEESYCELMRSQKISFEPIGDCFWSEMDFEEDLERILAKTHLP
jgi:choline kinase